MRFSLKYFLHLLGGGLGLAGVVFVALRLSSYAGQIDLARFNSTAWLIIVFLALSYGTANLMLARAWWHLLIFFDVKPDWLWTVKAYGLSQLAKYVPGNIFHIAGRQALGMAAGLPSRPLAKSAFWELGLIAVAGTLFGILIVPLAWPTFSLWLPNALFVIIGLTLITTLRHLLSPSIAVALVWQIAFLVASGFIFISVQEIVLPAAKSLPAYTELCGAYVLAWLAGLITPGAPAGVGVRELVLLSLLGGQVAQADLLLAIVLGRMVTVTGDFLFFLSAYALKPKKVGHDSNQYNQK